MKSSGVTIQMKCLQQLFYMVLFAMQQVLTLDSVQRAKKVVSDSPGLTDFAIALVNSVLNLPGGQVKWSFKEFKLHKNCVINPAYQIEKVFGASWNEFWASTYQLSYSLPEWQAVKLTFLTPAVVYSNLSFDGCLRSRPTHIYQAVLQSKLYCRVFWYNFTKWDLEFSWKFTCNCVSLRSRATNCLQKIGMILAESVWLWIPLQATNWPTKMIKSNFSSTLLSPSPFNLIAKKQDKFDQNQLSNFFALTF